MERLKKAVSTSLVLALILTSPGLAPYQAFAQNRGVRAVPIQGPGAQTGAAAGGLGASGLDLPALGGVAAPSWSQPGSAGFDLPALPPGSAEGAPRGGPSAPRYEQVFGELPGPTRVGGLAPGELLRGEVRPSASERPALAAGGPSASAFREASAAPAEAAAQYLKPSRETLGSADSASGWSRRSFAWLLGQKSAPQAVAAGDVAASLTAPAAVPASKPGPAIPIVPSRSAGLRSAPEEPAKASAPSAPAAPSAPSGLWGRVKARFSSEQDPQLPKGTVHENIGGWRWVQGLRREGVRDLPADASAYEIQARIQAQFGISSERLEAIALRFNLPRDDRKAWLWILDGMQKANAAEFKRMDSLKYSVSFRDLANLSYAEGSKGSLQRAAEVHKHFLGLSVRFTYHLFDMFVFGYFRQAISFQRSHTAEDFLGLREGALAEQWLASMVRERSFHRGGLLESVNSWAPYRALRDWLIEPFIAPLLKFVSRRVTLAAAGAAAMGLTAGLAPFLPLGLHMTALPFLGPAFVSVAHGVPAVVASLPVVGPALAPVFTAAFGALLKDLVLGKMLNTYVLSVLLTFPRAVALQWGRRWTPSPDGLTWTERAVRAAKVGAASTVWTLLPFGGFWSQSLKTFAGMITVGAEIEGVMTYADVADSALFGRLGWKPFHAIGAAVERPAGQSPIPFGGAITWGATLFHHVESAFGVSLSDTVLRATGHAAALAAPADARALIALGGSRGSAQAIVARATGELEQGEKDEAARRAQVVKDAGDLPGEIARVRARQDGLRAELAEAADRLAALANGDAGLPPDAQRRAAEQLRVLERQRSELATLRKLSESSDLASPALDDGRAKAIAALAADYEKVLSKGEAADPGQADALSVRLAALKALSSKLGAQGSRPPVAPSPDDRVIDGRQAEEIAALAGRIEKDRMSAAVAFHSRKVAADALQAASKVRGAALAERRGGPEMLEFRKNFARLSTVMDLSYSLNILNSAQAAIRGMQEMLDAKIKKIDASTRANQEAASAAQKNLNEIPSWKADAEKTKAESEDRLKQLQSLNNQTIVGAAHLNGFRTGIASLLASIDAQDGRGGSARAEYQRKLDAIPGIVKSRTEGYAGAAGNDTSKLSLKSLQDQLDDINKQYSDALAGQPKLDTVPPEVAGVLIVQIPGIPKMTGSPDYAATMASIAERKVKFNKDLDYYKTYVANLKKNLDPNNSAMTVDDFGDPQPESYMYWLNQEKGVTLPRERGETVRALNAIDAAAARIRAVLPSAPLSPLSGMGRAQLVVELPKYLDAINALPTPADSDQAFEVQMATLEIGSALPVAGRHLILWSKSESTITELEKGVYQILPVAQSTLEKVVALHERILTDADQDEALMRAHSDQSRLSTEEGNALIARKRELLEQNVLPTLSKAKALLENVLIPYQKDSISTLQQADPDADSLAKLYRKSLELYNDTSDALARKVPWAVASNGGVYGDIPGSVKTIDDREKFYRDNLKTIQDNLDDVARRKDPNFNGDAKQGPTEMVDGRAMHYSLPRRIAFYEGERAARAQAFNDAAKRLNSILATIDSGTGNKYQLAARFSMPTNVGPDPASVTRLTDLLKGTQLKDLGDIFTKIGDEAKAAGGGVALGDDSGSAPAPGVHPGPTLPPALQTALTAMQAGKILVPSTDGKGALALNGAEFLFANGVIDGSRKFEEPGGRLDQAKDFLTLGQQVLNASIADLNNDRTYIRSNGSNETGDQVFNRHLAVIAQQRAFTDKGVQFYGQGKIAWDQELIDSYPDINTFYNGLNEIYTNGGTINATERDAMVQMKQTLADAYAGYEKHKAEVLGWLNQLNRPEESALRRVSESISALQEKTKAVLMSNFSFHTAEETLKEGDAQLRDAVQKLQMDQNDLDRALIKTDMSALPASLRQKVRQLAQSRGSWMLQGPEARNSSIVVTKSELPVFLDKMLGTLFSSAANPTQDIGAVKAQILADPQKLTQVIPGSQLMEFGDDPNGFYLLYQSEFSTPGGFGSTSQVTLGNLTRVFGNNVSVNGYRFLNAPGPSAPFGDQGIAVTFESIDSAKTVNYLDITQHKFLQDIPNDPSTHQELQQMRLMVFEDFALLADGDKLYIGLTGFGDVPHPIGGNFDEAMKNRPSYYGGNLRTQFKMTELMTLDAKQQYLLANDPREFWETINLDFTGLDPDLNKDWVVHGKGEKKEYWRTELGPTFHVGDAAGWTQPPVDDEGKPVDKAHLNQFDVSLYWANTGGTDDINQQSLGTKVLTGVSISNNFKVRNTATGELGQKANTLGDRIDIDLPKGFTVFGSVKTVGDQTARQAGIQKKLASGTDIRLAYGSPYIGLSNRLELSMNSTFTLAELWSAVVKENAEKMEGGPALAAYTKSLDQLLGGDKAKGNDAELQRVFREDVGRQLMTQQVGTLTKDLQELYKAGALLDNTRVRGTLGWVSNPVGTDVTDRAAGGGMQMGTMTELSIRRSQRELIDKTIGEIYSESVKLQQRMVELTKEWQRSVMDVVMARWELALARYTFDNAPSKALQKEAKVRMEKASSRFSQASLKYNMLTGRSPSEAAPFENVTPTQLKKLMLDVEKLTSSPDRLSQVLRGLDPGAVKAGLPKQGFNLVDWLPFIEKITFGVGFQLQDALSNQALGMGGSVRLPIYDPEAKGQNKAYVLHNEAAKAQMWATYEAYRLKAQQERIQAVSWSRREELAGLSQPKSYEYVGKAVAAYRNGLIPENELWDAFDRWRYYTQSTLQARSEFTLARNGALLDADLAPEPVLSDPGVPGTLGEAFAQAVQPAAQGESRGSHGAAELGYKAQAAQASMEAADYRVTKMHLDLNIGWNMTASGIGWVPTLGFTAVGIWPTLGMQIKPQAMRELEVLKEQGRKGFYEAAQEKLRTDLEMEVYEAYVTLKTAYEAGEVFRTERLPELEAALKKAQAKAERDPRFKGEALSAQYALDQAKAQALAVQTEREEAQSLFNFLLSRPLHQPVELKWSLEEAQAELEKALAGPGGSRALEARRAMLQGRREVAEEYEQLLKENYHEKVRQADLISPILDSLSNLIHGLADEPYSQPDKVVWATQQSLGSRIAAEAFEKQLPVALAGVRQDLGRAEGRIRELSARKDPASRIELLSLQKSRAVLQAQLTALGGASSAPAAAAKYQPLPQRYDQLQRRVLEARQRLAAPDSDLVEGEKPSVIHPTGQSSAKYTWLNQSLGGDEIHQSYVESWAEIRLGSPDTAPETLLQLKRFERERGDRKYQEALQAAQFQASAQLARFESEVRQLRWAERSSGPQILDLKRSLEAALERDGRELAAMLGLDPATRYQELARLVPPGGPETAEQIAEAYIRDVERLNIEALQLTVYPEGLPQAPRGPDDLIGQAKADIVASRMSYKGFTPIAAFGYFRNRFVYGAFLEAPDPREIEHSLSNILGEAVRKDLEARGQMKKVSLRLHSLMASVQDGTRLVEAQQRRLAVAENEYAGMLVRFQKGLATAAEEQASKNAVDEALRGLSSTLIRVKTEFEDLVGELQALEIQRDNIPVAQHVDAEESSLSPMNVDEESLDYAAERLLDPAFAPKLAEALRGEGVAERAISGLLYSAESYRALSEQSKLVRAMDYAPAEKLDLLTTADVEGRRLDVREKLRAALTGPDAASPRFQERLTGLAERLLLDDIKAEQAKAESGRSEHAQALAALREAWWRGYLAAAEKAGRPVSWELRGAHDRLGSLKKAMDEAWQGAVESYVAGARPDESFVVNDQNSRLHAFLQAQAAYDREVVAVFAQSEVRARPDAARALDGSFDFRVSAAREQDLLKYGYGGPAITALVKLGEARLAALRWQGASPAALNRASEALAALRQKEKAWRENPRSIDALYAVMPVDAGGERSWKVLRWMTLSDLDSASSRGELVEKGGRTYFKQKPGEPLLELVGGKDAAAARLGSAQDLLAANRSERAVYDRLKSSDFALSKDPSSMKTEADLAAGIKGLSWEQYQAALKEGRIFFFRTEADRETGKHPWLHPLAAQWLSPLKDGAEQTRRLQEVRARMSALPSADDRSPEQNRELARLRAEEETAFEALQGWTAYYYEGKEPLKHSDYPTAETLDAGRFWKLTVGDKGLARLQADAGARRDAALRSGWTALKLQTYGFALGPDGRPAAVYLSKDEYDHAVERAAKKAEQLRLNQDGEKKEGSAALSRLVAEELEALEQAKADRGLQGPPPPVSAERRLTRAEREERDALEAERDRKLAELRLEQLRKGFGDLQHTLSRFHGKPQLDRFFKAEAPSAAAVEAGYLKSGQTPLAYMEDRFAAFQRKEDKAIDEAYYKDLVTSNPKADPSWSFHKARDLRWGLAADGTLVKVQGSGLDLSLGKASPERWVEGAVQAVETDPEGRLTAVYGTEKELEAAAKRWVLVDANWSLFDPKGARVQPGAREVRPTLRLRGFETGSGEGARNVVLGYEVLDTRIKRIESELGAVKRWAFMPQNWANILLETPRGIAQLPIELIFGTDSQHNHYLGRVMMNRTEGGATQRQGVFMSIAHFFDVLDLIPDPVRRFHDPSMFPDKVAIDGPIGPTDFVFDRAPRTEDEDIHIGRDFLRREEIRAKQELQGQLGRDMAHTGGLRERVRSYFEGGVERSFVELKRGSGRDWKGGTYYDSSGQTLVGQAQLASSLSDQEGELRGAGDGKALVSEMPQNLEVQTVEAKLSARLGAVQLQKGYEGLQRYAGELPRSRGKAYGDAASLEEQVRKDLDGLREAAEARRKADASERKTFDALHPLLWKLGAAEAREAERSYLLSRIAELEHELAYQKYYLERLLALQRPGSHLPPILQPAWRAVVAAAVLVAATALLLWQLVFKKKGKKK